MAPRTGTPSISHSSLPQREAPALVPACPPAHDDVVEAMAAMLTLEKPASAAEALRSLRLAYPDYPLALRLAGLAAAMKRRAPEPGGIYIPR